MSKNLLNIDSVLLATSSPERNIPTLYPEGNWNTIMKKVALHPTGVGMQALHQPNFENADSRPRGRVEDMEVGTPQTSILT